MLNFNLITESNPTNSDEAARQELKDHLSKSKRENREKGALHWAFVIILWIIVIIFLAVVVIYILHIVLPQSYCWLSSEQLKQITQFVTMGGIGGVGTALLKNKISNK